MEDINTCRTINYPPPTHDSVGSGANDELRAADRSNPAKVRDSSLDVFKFILICGVVIDHVMARFIHGRTITSLYVFLYTYNIPMFVLLVGYFSKIGIKTEKYVVSAFNVLALFLIFNLIMGVCFPTELTVNDILTPRMGAWFLLSLFFWKITLMYIKPFWINYNGLIGCIVISIIAYFCPLGEWFAFTRTVDMFPFLFLGLILKGTNFFQRLRSIPKIYPSLILIFALISIYFFHPFQNHIYQEYRGGAFLPLVERLLSSLAAVVMGLSVYCVLPHNNRFMAKMGQRTLFIYIYHLILLGLLVAVVKRYDLPMSWPYVALYIISIISICCILSNVKFLNDLTKPKYLSSTARCIYGFISSLALKRRQKVQD